MSRPALARAAAALLALACAAGPAAASMGPGLEVKVTGVDGPVRAGVPIDAQVTFTAHEPMTLKAFTFGLRGVTVNSDAPPDSVVLPDGGVQVVHVSAIPLATSDQFSIEVVANGVKVVHRRDWSQAYFDRLHYGTTVGFDPQPDPPIVPFAVLDAMRTPDPRPLAVGERSITGDPVMTPEQARRQVSALGVTANETHHLHGRVRFQRDDNSFDRVDGASYTIWLDTPAVDIPLASGTLSASGGYDRTVVVPSSLGRKFYLVFATDNAWVHVLDNFDGDEPFTFVTPRWDGLVGGGDLQKDFLIGMLDAPPLHILTTITREFRWFLDHTPYTFPDDIDDVDVAYPDSDWPHYAWPFTETINVPDSQWAWHGEMLIHEFGHHVNYELPIHMLQEDTEDGHCEPAGSPGRHCGWCSEDDLNVAIGEGFAQFWEQTVSLELERIYGVPIRNRSDWESLPPQCDCKGNGSSCSPWATEGFFGALLNDLADDTPLESDPNARATDNTVGAAAVAPVDRLSLGFNAVLDLMVDNSISTVQDFVSAFESRYGSSLPREDIFNTFANAGFWRDDIPPYAPTNLHSTDHTAGTPSPDGTISFAWTAPPDLGSGIQSYFVSLFRNGSLLTSATRNEPEYTTGELGPGTYHIEVRATDLQGNNSYPTHPIPVSPDYVVRDPYPTDLTKRLIAGWSDGVVARCVGGATTTNCLDTPTLAGNQDSTWFNWAVENGGEVPVDRSFRTRLLVDGVPVDSASTIVILTPPNGQTSINRGPFEVRGGRHTVEAWTDAAEVIAESSEANNRFGRQFVWKPLPLTRNVGYTRPAPPDRVGGWNVIQVPIGQPRFWNCDGFSYTHALNFPQIGTTRFVVSELWAERGAGRVSTSNDDLMLHYPSDGSLDGFTDGLVTSSRGAFLTDAILTNVVAANQSAWNLGVVNTSGNAEDFHLRVNSGGTSAVGDTLTFTVAQDQMVWLRDLNVPGGSTGKLTVEVTRVSGSGKFHVSWYSPTASFRSLANADGSTATNADGFASLSFTASTADHYPLLVWRDPSEGTAPVTLRLKIYVKPPDLAIVTPSGWAAPLVPRPTNDATVSSAPDPAILYGDDKPTWLNVSKRNASDQPSGFNNMQVRLDDDLAYGATFTGLAGLTTYVNPNITSKLLPGGRHVLSMLLDPTGVLPELDELNNTWGEQWSWVPDTLADATPVWRRGPIGGPMAGWEYCLPSEYLAFDCDGVRIPAPGAVPGFCAVAVAARDSGDVDATLHTPTNGADAGFDATLEDSNWGPGDTELLVLNYGLAARQAYDVGIVRVSDDTASVLVESAFGVTRNAAQNVHGPFTLAANHLVQVHEFTLPVGRYDLHLRNLSGPVDWAMALYDAGRPYQDRSQGEERGWSWENGPGQDEQVTFVAEQPTTIAIVVYKAVSTDAATSGTYQLELNANPTGVEGGANPAATRLAATYPNPCRDGASVRYDLARDENVAIEVYDLRGARVRSLVRAREGAGRHAVAWDGMDAAGRRAPAGVYLVRMTAGAYAGQQKVVRIE